MKNVARVLYVLFFAALLCAAALAQKKAAPPPSRPADRGPSLAFTLKYIQDKMAGVRNLNFVSSDYDNNPNTGFLSIKSPTDWKTQFIFEERNVVAHPDMCVISYHVKTIKAGVTVGDTVWEIPLKLIQRVMVMTVNQSADSQNVASGKPSLDSRIDSPLYILIAQRTGGATNTVYFADEDTANSVAQAMIYAAELCDDGNKDPIAPSTLQSEEKAQIPPPPPRPLR